MDSQKEWEKTRATLAIILKEVTYDPEPGYELNWHNLQADRSRLPPSYMVYLTLVLGNDCQYMFRPFEKTLWCVNLRFRDTPVRVEQGKFGLTLYAPSADDWSALIDPFIEVLDKAARFADRGAGAIVEDLLKAGSITIPNHYYIYDQRYKFFRKRAKRAYKTPPPTKNLLARNEKGEFVGGAVDLFKAEREGFFFGSASLESYFSRLEHLLVLLFPFSDSFGAGIDIVPFIASSWRHKFKRIFDLKAEKEARTLYNSLIAMKERYRNPVAHGGFEKGPSSLYVHFPVTGAIPVQLGRAKQGIHYSVYPMPAASFSDVIALFDRTDRYLREGPTQCGFMYVEAGLRVPCDSDSIQRYRAAMRSGLFKAFVEQQSYIATQNLNMEW